MARALATLILIGFLMQLVTFASGLGAGYGWFRTAPHILWGLLTSFLLLFSHSATMFYFIGRGRYVREVTRDLELDDGFIRRTKEIKQMFFPWATYAILLTIVVTTAGGAVTVWRPLHLMHGFIASAGVLLNSFALWRGLVGIASDLVLGTEMEAAGAAAGAAAKG